jgi:hypothetical protein
MRLPATDDVEVVVLSNPVASAGADQLIVMGKPQRLQLEGEDIWYRRTPPDHSCRDSTTSYFVTTRSNGCTDFASMILTVQPILWLMQALI